MRKKEKGLLQSGFMFGVDKALLNINKQRAEERPVVLRYTEKEAAMLFDLLHSEMETLMSLNTKNRLSEEPIFDQEQVAYLQEVMDFCAEQMKALSEYADIGG
jgi:hypothetical protein